MVSCPHCGSEFTGRGNLNRHMRMSHAEQGWSKTTKSERDDQHGSLPTRPIFSPEAWVSNPLIPPDFGQRLMAGNRDALWPAELKPCRTINATMTHLILLLYPKTTEDLPNPTDVGLKQSCQGAGGRLIQRDALWDFINKHFLVKDFELSTRKCYKEL